MADTTKLDREHAARFYFRKEGIDGATQDWIDGASWAIESDVDEDVRDLARLLAEVRREARRERP